MITATATLTETISVTASLGGIVCLAATYTLVDTDVPPNTLDSGSIASGAAATIVAPSATITVNTAPFGTAPSGGGLNVPVVSEDLTNAGTIIAGKVVIANTDVTINTVAVDSLQAEDTYALTVTRDSLPYTPTYNQGTRTVNVNSVPQAGGYVRNPDWLPLPELTSANERVCMLVIVFENRLNRVTVKYPNLTASTDWGDGTAATVSNGAKQEHLYDYASIAGTVYQWPNSGENYKQCILSTTRVGGAITNADFSDSYATAPVNQGAFIVDAIISLPNATILYMTNNFGRHLPILERLRIVGLGAIPAGSGWIRLGYSRNLQSIELPPNKIGNWTGAFTITGRCAVPDINWDAVTTCAQMFQTSDIISHGYLIANSSVSLAYYADGCENLGSFGYIDAPLATNALQMFAGCNVLQTVGDIDAPLLQNCTSMFSGCFALGSVRFLDASAITTTTNMFANCLSLYDLEMFGLTRGINLTNSSMGNYGVGNFAASLGTASGAQTITVTGTPFGALLTALDATALAIRLVMTGKGYTVVN